MSLFRPFLPITSAKLRLLSILSLSTGLLSGCLLWPPESPAQSKSPPSKPAQAKPVAVQNSYPNFTQGASRYQEKRYNEAIACFSEAIKKGEAGAAAWLYIAHSYLAMGNRQEAVNTYQKIAAAFPTSQEAQVSRTYLQKLGAPLPTDAPAAGATTASTRTASESYSDIKSRIEIVRPVMGHPPVSELMIHTVHKCIDNLPKGIRKILNRGQIKLILTPTLIDKDPSLAYQEGRGYEGNTYKSCPGMFYGDSIYICERTVDENNDEVKAPFPMNEIEGTFYHETGHAIDACLGDFSEKDDYRHAYYLDIARVPDSIAHRIRYYLQKSVAGQQEACAELTRILLGNEDSKSGDMKASFPNTIKIIKQKTGL